MQVVISWGKSICISSRFHRSSRNQHIRPARSMEAINTKMFLSIAAHVYPKSIHGKHPLRGRRDNKTSHKVGLAARFTEKLVREERRLIEVAHQIGEGGDVVWKVTAATGPDGQERDAI